MKGEKIAAEKRAESGTKEAKRKEARASANHSSCGRILCAAAAAANDRSVRAGGELGESREKRLSHARCALFRRAGSGDAEGGYVVLGISNLRFFRAFWLEDRAVFAATFFRRLSCLFQLCLRKLN